MRLRVTVSVCVTSECVVQLACQMINKIIFGAKQSGGCTFAPPIKQYRGLLMPGPGMFPWFNEPLTNGRIHEYRLMDQRDQLPSIAHSPAYFNWEKYD